MEYLMTYGWAILVVLIALGALFYLGVFNPKTNNVCSASAPITCTDVKATGTSLILSVGSTGTTTATMPAFGSVTLTEDGVTKTCTVGPTPDNVISTTTIGLKTYTCPFTGANKKFAGSAVVTYTPIGGQSHTTTLSFSGTVE
ncbi:hypothetical protein J4405_05295 [Candidatus Woesearchaeota archaeon]|nr:hypothetical protein [Candidatus Woesearchaeota archaeon]